MIAYGYTIKLAFLSILACAGFVCRAQTADSVRVGVVLSGGGALGFAHIGALKALEEHGVPVDCIAGTSSGALIGAFYAAGYSPSEIESRAVSTTRKWLSPGIEFQKKHYPDLDDPDGSFLEVPVSFRDVKRNLPDNLFSDYEINIGLNKLLAAADGASENNFDSLFVPFRAVAADVFEQRSVILSKGSLPFAVRASMAVPLFFTSVSNDSLENLYDGGVYDNFPVEPMINAFAPDFIIGVHTGGAKPTKKDIQTKGNFIRTLISQRFVDQKTWEKMPEESFLIMPDLQDMSVFDFDEASIQRAINAGYEATTNCLNDLRQRLDERRDSSVVQKKRAEFRKKWAAVQIDSLNLDQLPNGQSAYIKNLFNTRKMRDLNDLDELYYRLNYETHYYSVFPRLYYQAKDSAYLLKLSLLSVPRFSIKFGGAFFSPTDHQLVGGIIFRGTSFIGYETELKLVQGSFQNIASFRGRINLPSKLPIFLELENYVSFINHQRLTFTLFNSRKSANVFSRHFVSNPKLIFPLYKKLQITAEYMYLNSRDRYHTEEGALNNDTLDNSYFDGNFWSLSLQRNTLNKKMYADRGSIIRFKSAYRSGWENYRSGSVEDFQYSRWRDWIFARFNALQYFRLFKRVAIGVEGNVSWTNMPLFNNAVVSRLLSPKYLPFQDSPLLFIPTLHSKAFISIGGKAVFNFTDKFQARANIVYYHSFHTLEELPGGDFREYIDASVRDAHWLGSFGFVYETTIGPIGAFFNYYDYPEQYGRAFIHLGYLIFKPSPWN